MEKLNFLHLVCYIIHCISKCGCKQLTWSMDLQFSVCGYWCSEKTVFKGYRTLVRMGNPSIFHKVLTNMALQFLPMDEQSSYEELAFLRFPPGSWYCVCVTCAVLARHILFLLSFFSPVLP